MTLPTVDIKGTAYTLVKDRIIYFNETFPNGCIQTELCTQPLDKVVMVKAIVIPDVEKPRRFFTGYSQAVIGEGFINKTAALENCETSAVGRALAMLGIGVVESVASADEVHKAVNASKAPPSPVQQGINPTGNEPSYSDLEAEANAAFGLAPSNDAPFKSATKVVGAQCNDCTMGKYVSNPKTGKIFCDHKCWLNK